MFCISVSYKKTPAMIRQQFAFSGEEQERFLSELIGKGEISGGVIVSTCNRSEIYFTGGKAEPAEELLCSLKGIRKENIRKYCLYYQGKKAVRHLFRVICGLDSMILGEDEILHQVKEAYLFSNQRGYTDSELNIIFQGGFHCAKLSKTATGISRTPVSIGTLTANVVSDFLKNAPKGKEGSVLVIGATGKIGSIVAKDLMAKGIPVMGTSRKRTPPEGLYLQEDDRIRWLEFQKRYDAVDKAAAIVSATNSPHYTLTKEEFLHRSDRGKPYLMIDLAVPFDIDRELAGEGNITLLDIDYFKGLSRRNNNLKLSEKEKAEGVLQECAEEVLKKLYLKRFMEQKREKFEEKWFRQMIHYLRDTLDSDRFLEVLEGML